MPDRLRETSGDQRGFGMPDKTVEDRKHAAGGPGKAAKEGHIDPGKHNKPSQDQHGPRVTTKGPRNAVRGEKGGRPG
jgi:hypothetical protein